MIDRLTEMGSVLWRNRVRTVLTMLSVAWGIFMLVLLLGMGRGLENNVAYQFRDDATNSIWIYRGKTTKPWDGYPVGRRLQFTNRDHDAIASRVDGVNRITSRFYPARSGTIVYGDRKGQFDIRSVHPDHQVLENTIMIAGRYLNNNDLAEKRKVAVIGRKIADQLFGSADPLGAWIDYGGVPLQVVGVYRDEGQGEEDTLYFPITTAQAAFAGGERVDQIMFTVGDATTEQAEVITQDVRNLLAERLHFDPADRRAVRVRNNVEEFAQFQQIISLLNGFVWIIGLGTVTAGIVSVSNIMLVSVKERTAEIGLRKALGATPTNIVSMVVFEALVLTGVSGYAGLVAGVSLLEVIRRVMGENEYIRDPDIDLSVAIAATALLIFSGMFAGLVPALRAATINPIEALRDE